MIHAFHRYLLDRFVLRPSRNRLPHDPKQRVLMTVEGLTDEHFVERPRVRQAAAVRALSGQALSGQALADQAGNDRLPSDALPELLVLKFPGTSGRAERSSPAPANYLPSVDTTLATWNAPGYGRSSGRATLESIAHRAARFSRLITAQPQFRRVPVWLFGNSLGCATAAYVASLGEVPVAGIILRNPPPLEATVKRVARRYPFGQWADPIAESLPPEMNLLRTAPRVRAPTVFLQSEHDRLVPPELQRQVHEALAGTKRLVVLRGLGHDGPIGEEHEDEVAAAVTWLWQRSAATARPTASESRAPLQSGEA